SWFTSPVTLVKGIIPQSGIDEYRGVLVGGTSASGRHGGITSARGWRPGPHVKGAESLARPSGNAPQRARRRRSLRGAAAIPISASRPTSVSDAGAAPAADRAGATAPLRLTSPISPMVPPACAAVIPALLR